MCFYTCFKTGITFNYVFNLCRGPQKAQVRNLSVGDVMLMQHMAPIVLEIHLKHVEEFISFVGITLFCKVKDALP